MSIETQQQQPSRSLAVTLGNTKGSDMQTSNESAVNAPHAGTTIGGRSAVEPGLAIPGLGFVAYKHIALLMLVAQTVGGILALRVSRTFGASEVKYLNTTAVFMSELVKLLCSILLVIYEDDWNLLTAYYQFKTQVWMKPIETLKVGVPAILYALQNNLLFIALSNMSPATYQVTYQLKILTTAILSVLILRKFLNLDKWISLFMLTTGVALIQIPSSGSSKPGLVDVTNGGNPVIGTIAVLCACVTSGFAGVYFEKILKDSKTSIWMRNIQLALLGCIVSLIGSLYQDGRMIMADGFFQGYNATTWVAILTQSAGGLIVAAVLKYADNILKCFGNAIAIVMSCLISYYYLGDYQPNIYFLFGTILVITATYTYGVNARLFSTFLPKQIKAHSEIQMKLAAQV